MQATDRLHILQAWFSRADRWLIALLIGLSMGLLGGILGIAVVMFDPVLVGAGLIGLLLGLYIITDVQVALYAIVMIALVLPFGTLPFDIGFTPTLLDTAIGGFLLIYIASWMTRRRTRLILTPVHLLISIYLLWLLLAFALGLRHSPMTLNIVRQFAGMLLAIGLVFVVVDLLRDPQVLRRVVLVVLLGAAAQSILAIGLWALPDTTADLLLSRLGRLGYPQGGVIQYIESNPALGERAIGTFIAPNSLGGMLAIAGVIVAPQVFARKPVLRYRWLTLLVVALIGLALIVSFSRASALALAFGLGVLAITRYRRFVPLLIFVGLMLLMLPQTQFYIDRFLQAFRAEDLATQMRIGEWTDSLRLIQRYPIYGVGFTGTPDIDIYTDVANMYLIMANQIGLVGVAVFLTTMVGVLLYGAVAWGYARRDDELEAIHIGYHAAVITALVNAVADLYFFRIDFQPLITLFWLTVALALASSRLVLERASIRSGDAEPAEKFVTDQL